MFLLTFGQTVGQKKQCHCDKEPSMDEATTNCKTTIFKNKSKLYWQFNCDRIWLTLENSKGQKSIINEVDVQLFGYTYRLGFHLVKEFNKTLLFRSGCPATGPCFYTLIDKTSGKKIKEFDQLICINTDSQWNNSHKYAFEFVVSLSSNLKYLTIYYIDSKKTLTIPFNEQLTNPVPQHEFDDMTLKDNLLTLHLTSEDKKEKTIHINLDDKKYSRKHSIGKSGG
jgi:hypothetical protein